MKEGEKRGRTRALKLYVVHSVANIFENLILIEHFQHQTSVQWNEVRQCLVNN